MEKTTVYLTTEQKAALAAAAREQGRSEARLIRDGIDEVLAGHGAREGRTPVAVDKAGDDVGDLHELARRPRWVSRQAFLDQFEHAQADPALRAELRDLAPELTDELPDR